MPCSPYCHIGQALVNLAPATNLNKPSMEKPYYSIPTENSSCLEKIRERKSIYSTQKPSLQHLYLTNLVMVIVPSIPAYVGL